MPAISVFRDREPPIYKAETRLIRVGNSIGVLLPIIWGRDNGLQPGDKVIVQVEGSAHYKKRQRQLAASKPKPNPLQELEDYFKSHPVEPSQPNNKVV